MEGTLGASVKWGMGLLVALAVSASAGAAGAQSKTSGDPSPTLVFVAKSDACECERNLSIIGEQVVVNFVADNPWGFRRETVDLTETPEAAKELEILTVPVVFLLDDEGRRIARFDGFFSERDLREAWKNHLDEGGK